MHTQAKRLQQLHSYGISEVLHLIAERSVIIHHLNFFYAA